MNKKNLKAYLLTALALISLSGCDSEINLDEHEYTEILNIKLDDLSSGIEKVLDVEGYDFKLFTKFRCDDLSKRAWRVTTDKFLYMDIKTENLPEDTLVYIDNIHIDTSIKSTKPEMDGIKQDSMDDRVHSSSLIGFYISDEASYHGVNAIEGANQEFIEGTLYGYRSVRGEIESKRFTEDMYLDLDVYANKIQVVIDLLIKSPNDKDFRNISVSTDFIIPFNGVNIEKLKNQVKDSYQNNLSQTQTNQPITKNVKVRK